MIKQHLNEAYFERLRVYLEHTLERYGNKDSHFVASLFAKIWHLSNVKYSNHCSVCFLHSWWRIAFTRSISKHICVHRRAFACSHLTFSCFLNTQRSRNCSPEGQVLRVPYCQIYRAQNWCRWSRATNVYTKKNWLSILLAAWKNKRSTAKYSTLKKLSMFTRTVSAFTVIYFKNILPNEMQKRYFFHLVAILDMWRISTGFCITHTFMFWYGKTIQWKCLSAKYLSKLLFL